MTITAGIDLGTGAVKAVIFDVENGGHGEIAWLSRHIAKIRRRDPHKLAREAFEAALAKADFSTLPPDKLAVLLIRLAEIARDDEPPTLSITVGVRTI
ncbi:MAG: hypothetical protein IIC53_10545 [Proteobacteria bacterium]|nr:hypothetical protein [Pseudomonadota bacterium]